MLSILYNDGDFHYKTTLLVANQSKCNLSWTSDMASVQDLEEYFHTNR